jgi:lipopolysaccharide export system ATP-binding protein
VTQWPLHRRARAGLGYLPQQASVLPRLTAAQNVAVALASMGRETRDAPRLLAEAGLGALTDRFADSLSGGERRRVEVVRCLALRPCVVLMDEPFAGVDPAHVTALQERIRALAATGLGVLLTDHAVREALPICDRAIVLDGGVVQVTGTPEQVAADARARERYLGAAFRLEPVGSPLQNPAQAYNGSDQGD